MVNLLKKKIFIHQNIPYAFNWNIAHHKEKILQDNPNREAFIKLGSYFKGIYKGEIPNDLFNLQRLSRVSQFKMRGLKPAFITSFSKKLIREGKIRYFGSDSKLPNYTQNVFESFKINKKILKSWAVKILAILIVLAMILTGFVVIFWK